MNERDKEYALKCQLISEHTTGIYREALQKFADLIRADEREACALICDEHADDPVYCGAAIRARGDI